GLITEGNTYTYLANLAIGNGVPAGVHSITVTVQTSDANNGNTPYDISMSQNFVVQTTATAITALAPSLQTTVAQGERGVVVSLPITFGPAGSGDITVTSVTWNMFKTATAEVVTGEYQMTPITTFPVRFSYGGTNSVSFKLDAAIGAKTGSITIRPEVVTVADANTGRDLTFLVDETANLGHFTVAGPKPVLRITGMTLSPNKVSVPQQIYTTLTVENLGAASANLLTTPIAYQFSSGATDVTSQYSLNLVTTATTQIPGYQTRSFQVQIQVKPTATTYGLISVDAGIDTTNAADGTSATSQVMDIASFTVYKGSADKASYTLTAYAPGAIEKTSQASGNNSTYQAKVELAMTSLSSVADATVSNISLAMKIGTQTVTTEYDTGTAPSTFTISAGQTKRVTWNVTALNTATKGQP
ncbi:MAG: hypothetical protein FD127_4226, partial [Acidimicrobiaceae bacterium]